MAVEFSCITILIYPILEENTCRLKTPRTFCLILRCCDARMWNPQLCQRTCASVHVRLHHW